ncbi:MAG TPA: DnaJ domain-containing protein [Polyangiales bacterium]|nr:DnaJ domain-containing protein [Polyangiales bacterium]
MLGHPTTLPAPPQARPHRLEPRYPLQCELGVQVGSALPVHYPTRDVSRGGVFLACADPVELFSEVSVLLPLAAAADELLPALRKAAGQTQTIAIPARVVHSVSRERARAAGGVAGMGLQFDPSSPEHHAAIEAFVGYARAHDPRPRFPRRREGRVARAESDPMLGYLLDAIDGQRGPEELAETLGLPLSTTEDMLRELAALGAIELLPLLAANSGTVARPPARSSVRPQRRRRGEQGLAPEVRAELATIWAQLADLDHYQLLGVSRAADREQIRQRFFELSKRFHPDAHYGACDAEELAKLERVFARLSHAYGALARPASRAEYDRYLDQRNTLQRLVEAGTSGPPPVVSGPALAFRSQPTAAEVPAVQQLWSELQARSQRREIVEQLRMQAEYEQKHQRWAEAAATWRRMCAEDPHDALAHRSAALAAHHAGLPAEVGLGLAARAVELAPRDAVSRRVLGQLYLAAGMKQKAREQFDAARVVQGEARA